LLLVVSHIEDIAKSSGGRKVKFWLIGGTFGLENCSARINFCGAYCGNIWAAIIQLATSGNYRGHKDSSKVKIYRERAITWEVEGI